MRVLRVHNLASELDLLPDDLAVMIVLGRNIGYAQGVAVPDSASNVEILSTTTPPPPGKPLEELRALLTPIIRQYCEEHDWAKIRPDEIVDLCVEVVEKMQVIP